MEAAKLTPSQINQAKEWHREKALVPCYEAVLQHYREDSQFRACFNAVKRRLPSSMKAAADKAAESYRRYQEIMADFHASKRI